MKLVIRRSAAVVVEGKPVSYIRFEFDGHDAGTLEIPWDAWRVWNKALLAGQAASLTPYDQVVEGYILEGYEQANVGAVFPAPGSQRSALAQLPKLDDGVELPEIAEEFAATLGQGEIARFAQLPTTTPIASAARAKAPRS